MYPSDYLVSLIPHSDQFGRSTRYLTNQLSAPLRKLTDPIKIPALNSNNVPSAVKTQQPLNKLKIKRRKR